MRGAAFFLAGCAGYPVIEVLWRGRTHWTMSILGGVCAWSLYEINRRMRRNLLARAAAGMAAITVCEFLGGLVVNKWLKWDVWDYSDRALNLMGQICPAYCAAWFGISLIASAAMDGLWRENAFSISKL